MRKFIRKSLFLFGFLTFAAFSQTVQFIPDSAAMANFWHISSKTALFVGATFYYTNSDDSIVVSLESSESDATGELYCMIPGFTDSAFYLFTNKSTGARVNLTGRLASQIPEGTEIFFMYKRENAVINRRYTGQNREGVDPQDKSLYHSSSFVSREFGVKPGYGHRFAAAGRIVDSLGAVTDTIVFGFEDDGIVVNPLKDSLVAADFDLNDVIFKVTGLNLNVEPFPDSLVMTTESDTVSAGDTVDCKVQVWIDSAGSKIRSSKFDSLVTWKLLLSPGDDINHDSLSVITDTTALFFPRTAYKQFVINASLISSLTNETLAVRKTLVVRPGIPSILSIELRSDTGSTTFSMNSAVEIPRVQISSNKGNQLLYALLRDKFGNFTGFSQFTIWDTSYSGIIASSHTVASIQSGNTGIGEGIVEKTGIGNVFIAASVNQNGNTLTDKVLVNTTAGYDSLRIRVVEDTDTLIKSSMAMTTDTCRMLIAEGKRIDTRLWETIPVSWSSGRWADVNGTADKSVLLFCPADTGTGYIQIDFQGYFSRLPLRVTHGRPVRLSLYTNNNTLLGSDTTAAAGTPFLLLAELFDKRGCMISDAAPGMFTWELIEKSSVVGEKSSGYISDTVGTAVTFNPLLARRIVRIFSRYDTLCDSIDITIVPGRPFRIVIESHADWQKTMYVPDEIDTIEIPDDRTDVTVYAMVRDSIGNYIDSLRSGTWGSTDSIVYVNQGLIPSIGSIRKNIQVVSGICKIYVTDGILNDTANVKLMPYHYIDLKIMTRDGVPVDSLSISTNADTVLYVKALRSDTAIWKEISANWSSTGDIVFNSTGPRYFQSFTVSPVKPGSGYITADITGTNNLSDTIPVQFTRGSPTHAEFSIITPSGQIIAGDTIKAAVHIYNQDGLVPGVYCFSSDSISGAAVYQDTLRYNAYRPDAKVFSGTNSSGVNIYPDDTARIPQCFTDGVDTIRLISYYSPYSSDSLHQFQVKLGTITASTPSFRLKPSLLSSITISHTHICCPDTLVMRYPKDQVLLYTIGFDKYGNMRGSEPCDWSTTGTLHKFGKSDSLTRLVYSADSAVVSDDQSGSAIAVSSVNPQIIDSLYINIIGPLAYPVSAVTGDLNGNGYIDIIRVRFDMPVFCSSELINSRLAVSCNVENMIVDSTEISIDSMYMNIYLNESEKGNLQTNWKPVVKLDNYDFILGGAVENISIEALDGAGPVIAYVRKDLNGSVLTDDLVTVTFSEDVFGPDGNIVSLYELPAHVFETWIKNTSGGFVKVNLIDGIKNFNSPVFPDSISFSTSNGVELTSSNYFSILNDLTSYKLIDAAGNTSSVNNRKVRVNVFGTVGNELLIGPNPGIPTCKREIPGEFHLYNNSKALEWIKQDNGGIAISFQITLPDKNSQLGGRITIYDMIGNTVASDPEVDYRWMNLLREGAFIQNTSTWGLVPSGWNADGSVYNYTIYWNGFNDEGARVAPGVYRVILNLVTRTSGKDKVTSYRGLIGIKK